MEHILTMTDKKGGITSIKCKDQTHFDKLLLRFKRKGFKQIENIKETITNSLPF
jgi:hypothetical protein